MADPKLNHQMACSKVRSSEYTGFWVTFSSIVSPTAVNIAEDTFCMVVKGYQRHLGRTLARLRR